MELITNCDEFGPRVRVRANTAVVLRDVRRAKILLPILVNLDSDRSFSAEGGSVKVSEILEMLRRDGWYLVTTRGSHRQFKHASKPGRVTVPGKPSDDLPPGLLNSILKQSGLKR